MVLLNLFIPITKIDVEKRLVYGIAADETPDHADEIFDYDSSKSYFEEWSGDISKATDGKSLGNLRAMHTGIAAGKVTQLVMDDVAKSMPICAKVVDDNEWNKCLEGVYTGFSIGGSYVKRWKDPNDPTKTRYTAKPAEISIVDLGCNPSATFEIIKADGLTEQREFKRKEEPMEVNKTILADMQKALTENDLVKAFSFEEIRDRLRGAINSKLKTPFNCGYFWIQQTYPDSVIIEGDMDGDGDDDMYQIAYTIDDQGVVTLGDAKQVKVSYVPVVDEDGTTDEGAELMGGKADQTGDLQKTEEKPAEPIIEEKPIEKAIEAESLEKAGAKHSKDTIEQLQQMHHNIADMGGACQCDKCQKLYQSDDAQKSIIPDELTKVSTAAADLHKGENESLTKFMERFDSLEKALNGFKTENEALAKKVIELENAPLPGGPILNATAMEKSLVGGGNPEQTADPDTQKIALYEQIIAKSDNPAEIQTMRMQLSTLKMKQIYS